MPFLITCPCVCVSFCELRTRFAFSFVGLFCFFKWRYVALCWIQMTGQDKWCLFQYFTHTFEESTFTLQGLGESHSFARHSLSLPSEQLMKTALQFVS